jgi:hypothetical protein
LKHYAIAAECYIPLRKKIISGDIIHEIGRPEEKALNWRLLIRPILRLKSRPDPYIGRMIEHLSVPISDYKKSKQFYLEALKPLDYVGLNIAKPQISAR